MGVYHYSRVIRILVWIEIAYALVDDDTVRYDDDVVRAAQQRAYAGDSMEASSLEDSTSGKTDKGEIPVIQQQAASLVREQDVAMDQQPSEVRPRNSKTLIRTHIIGDRVVSDSGELDDVVKAAGEEQILVHVESDQENKMPSEKQQDVVLTSFMRKNKPDEEPASLPADPQLSAEKLPETSDSTFAASQPIPEQSDPSGSMIVGAKGETGSDTLSPGAVSDLGSQLDSTSEDMTLPESDESATVIDTTDDTQNQDSALPVEMEEPEHRTSCCDHRRRRQVLPNKCSTSRKGNKERWWCDLDFPSAGVCGCFGGAGSGHKAECAWCGKDVFHGEPGDQDCKFVNKKMTMSGCDKDAADVKAIAPWFSGWGEYILCENGLVASGKNATCHHTGGGMTGYHQRWYTDDCNFVYIFYYRDNRNVHNAFSVLTHLDREQRFKHEHWLHDTYIECDARSSTCAGSY